MTEASRAAERARERGATAHVLDASTLVSKRATLDGIAEVLSFPAWAGRNLDALYDCLIDLSWLPEGEHVLVWAGHRSLAALDPAAYDGIARTLRDASRPGFHGRSFRVEFTQD